MKRNWWPEIWSVLGLAAMAWSLFESGPAAAFHFVVGLLALNRGAILENKRELDRWRQL